jgi:hypothetical protein
METNAVLQADRSAFIVAEEHFKPLYNISSAKDATLNMVANKVRFLWFPAKVASSSQNINTEYNHVKQTEKNLQEQLDIFNKPKVEVSIPKAVVPPKVKDVAKPVTPSPIPRNVGKNQQRMIGDRVHTQTTVYDNSNDIDALDIMFMYNYPNLAPMYKPNSMLAWYMFFDRSDTEMSRQTINNNVQQIAGFENVANADLKYHQSGYSVTMYEDEQKTKPLGVLNHDNNTGCYEMTSPSGEKTLLKVDDSGVISGCVSSPEKASTNFGFVEKDNGFVGNWDSSPTEGVKISSGMSVSEDYTVSSTPNETIDLGAVLRSNEEAVQNYKVESPKDEWVPPPPPPPPPPSSEWGSSDPYSNTASFKM